MMKSKESQKHNNMTQTRIPFPVATTHKVTAKKPGLETNDKNNDSQLPFSDRDS